MAKRKRRHLAGVLLLQNSVVETAGNELTRFVATKKSVNPDFTGSKFRDGFDVNHRSEPPQQAVEVAHLTIDQQVEQESNPSSQPLYRTT